MNNSNNNVKDRNLGIVLSEVNDIIYFSDATLKDKIPKSFLKFIEENKDSNYISNINPYLPFEEQEISEEAKNIIALIYRSYIASEEEKKEYQEKDTLEFKKMEEEKREKYNPNSIFENEYADNKFNTKDEDLVEKNEEIENNKLMVIKNISIFQRIKNFIKKFLNKI